MTDERYSITGVVETFGTHGQAIAAGAGHLAASYGACDVVTLTGPAWQNQYFLGGRLLKSQRSPIWYRVTNHLPGQEECGGGFTTALWLGMVRDFECPADLRQKITSMGYTAGVGTAFCYWDATAMCPLEGNPVSLGLGNKIQREVDFTSDGTALSFARTYNYMGGRIRKNEWSSSDYGFKFWNHTYDRRVWASGAGEDLVAVAERPNGEESIFFVVNGQLVGRKWSQERLERLTDGSGAVTGWRLTTRDDKVEAYDALGRLLTLDDPRSATLLTMAYVDGRLASVSDRRGRSLQLSYDGEGRLQSLTDPNGQVFAYSWDSLGRLTSVSYPGSSSKTYHYESTTEPYALTGITDENGDRFATYAYDSRGRVSSEVHGAGVNQHTFSYSTWHSRTTQANVTDPLGTTRTYSYSTAGGRNSLSSVSAPCTSCGDSNTKQIDYDANGNIAQRIDFRNTRTQYQYDSTRNLEVKRTEAVFNGPAKRITETAWHADFRVPLTVSYRDSGNQLTAQVSYTYNTRGQRLSVSEIDPASGQSRTTSFAYCEAVDVADPSAECPLVGLLKSEDGPRTDLADVTSYAYYTQDAGDGAYRRGDLKRVTNALGHATEYLRYDGAGRPLQVRDPNGVLVSLAYHPRGWLSSTDLAGTLTSMIYDSAGQLIRSVRPDGSHIAYEYDTAHRLIAIEDSLLHRMEFVLDDAGNRTAVNTKDPSGTLRRQLLREYDDLGRLTRMIDGVGNPTQYTYDSNGNNTLITDPLGRSTAFAYDALDRLNQAIDSASGVVATDFDDRDNLLEVTDQRGLVTSYDLDGFGDLVRQTSPDTGTTQLSYDSAGNRQARVDARGVTVGFEYDALNRMTKIDFDGSALDIVATFDQGAFGVGRMTQLTDASGTTSFTYDARGNLTQEARAIDGLDFLTQYAFDSANRLTSMTYPSGRSVDYSYDALGRVETLTRHFEGTSTAIATGFRYEPFGPANGWTFSNGVDVSRIYDLANRITELRHIGIREHVYSYDTAGNISTIDDQLGVAGDQTLSYDSLDRLSTAGGAYGNQTFQYDAVGNRTQQIDGASVTPYSYALDSNRLSTVGAQAVSLDSVGNTVNDGHHAYFYDDRNRLVAIDDELALYQYNGHGERVKKTVGPFGDPIYFVYGLGGELLGEYDHTGAPIKEYVYFESAPIAVLAGGEIFAVHADHLGTPRAVSDGSGTKIWQWESDPFGATAADPDPDGDGNAFTFNLRFPGQYYDAETGNHHNYFRDYDPALGRYLQSDPIGIRGGLNTFGYARQEPIQGSDPSGLRTLGPRPGPHRDPMQVFVCDFLELCPAPRSCKEECAAIREDCTFRALLAALGTGFFTEGLCHAVTSHILLVAAKPKCLVIGVHVDVATKLYLEGRCNAEYSTCMKPCGGDREDEQSGGAEGCSDNDNCCL
ncbi:MAG: RHS repeat-associated core domain-containing protein [Acidobacteriota bacterium]